MYHEYGNDDLIIYMVLDFIENFLSLQVHYFVENFE